MYVTWYHGYHEPTSWCRNIDYCCEFGYEVEFITVDIEEAITVVEDKEEDLV
jgi:hypothetical protein